MRVSVGTDIVAVERIAKLVRDRGDTFLSRWFTPDEISYCMAKAQPPLHLAARMAAKEAVAKSLRTSWPGPPPWRDIRVEIDDSGAPCVELSGDVQRMAADLGIDDIQISMSHSQDYATATAVALSRGPASPGRAGHG